VPPTISMPKRKAKKSDLERMAGASSIAVYSRGSQRENHQPSKPLTTVSEKNASSHADIGPPARSPVW
jgi:hypothetical protein